MSSDRPGAVSQPGAVGGVLFDQEVFGTFRSYDAFIHWFQLLALDGYTMGRKAGLNTPLPCFSSDADWEGPVFCHGDIHLGNIILGDDECLWLIDWDSSGFFPPAFEALCVSRYADASPSWKAWVPWIVGSTSPELLHSWELVETAIVHRRWSQDTSRA